ncbi:hypothetical protein K2F43_22165 [Clostridium estertheticum]|uniref:hypothetical protein n=1 Tax=Clostridium estertheticum TaxID=238834 RepID=UPI001C6E683A|nr:hypothetical protein [Clostridium estertheticum]MBW9173874.1 hypothetical protein [Clostridium estertheticum]WLC77798.1 hypothetical protein KTC99_23485 [Clostridium estertheticum]
MGLLTLDKVQGLDKKLDTIENYLVSLEMKIDIISKDNTSIKNIEASIVEIKNQLFQLNKNVNQ